MTLGKEGANEIGLSRDVLASSLGKVGGKLGQGEGFKNEDYYSSFLTMFAVNLGNIGSLIAQIEKIRSIVVLPSQFDSEPLKGRICSVLEYYLNLNRVEEWVPKIYFVDDQSILATLGIHLKLMEKDGGKGGGEG